MNRRPKKFRRGERLTTKRLNQVLDYIPEVLGGRRIGAKRLGNKVTLGRRAGEIIPNIGAGGGATLFEVAIVKALAVADDVDPAIVEEADNFGNFGPHLKAYLVDSNGSPMIPPEPTTADPYTVIFPHHGFTVDQFKRQQPPAGQIFSLSMTILPVFLAYGGSQGATLMLGDGQRWTQPPTVQQLCSTV